MQPYTANPTTLKIMSKVQISAELYISGPLTTTPTEAPGSKRHCTYASKLYSKKSDVNYRREAKGNRRVAPI